MWVPQAAPNGTAPTTFYTTFDLSSFNAYSQAPRVYKKVVYTPVASPDGTTGTLVQGTITTFPLWTAIITLANGVPTGVRWDEGCFFCPANGPACAFSSFDTTACASGAAAAANYSTPCTENPDAQHMSCFTDMGTCYPLLNGQPLLLNTSQTDSAAAAAAAAALLNSTLTTLTPTPTLSPSPTPSTGAPAAPVTVPDTSCDLKVFVVWDGTDARGNVLKSVNRRFSVYRAFSVATAYQSALNVAQQGLDIANSVQNVAQGLPGALTPGAAERRERRAVAGEGEAQQQGVQLRAGAIDPPLPGVTVPKA